MDMDPATYRTAAHAMENNEFGTLEKIHAA
jgi:hypothetical protein